MGLNSQVITTSDGVGVRLSSLRTSGQESLLMLHGVGRAGRTFSSLAMMFPERFHVRALDFRGHGSSGRANVAYRVIDYVRDAVAAIDALPAPVILYGHSLGALVSAAAAAERPERITAVILEDPPSAEFWARLGETQYHPVFQAMRRWAGRLDLTISELADGFGNEIVKSWSDGRQLRIRDVRDSVSLRFSAACIRELDPAVMDSILQEHWLSDYDYTRVFSSIRCPLLLLRGNPDMGGMLSEENARQLQQLTPSMIRLDFPSVGHLLHWQVRSEVAGQVSAFLESL